jgi:hypothetical protein
MCAGVARHPAEWRSNSGLSIDPVMPNELPPTFARRARLSSKAIFTAIALTLAALVAIAVAAHDHSTATVKTLGPVSRLPVDPQSVLVPVIDR